MRTKGKNKFEFFKKTNLKKSSKLLMTIKKTLIFYSSVKNQIILVYVNNNFILFVKCIRFVFGENIPWSLQREPMKSSPPALM
jgi:hypothetical protein